MEKPSNQDPLFLTKLIIMKTRKHAKERATIT